MIEFLTAFWGWIKNFFVMLRSITVVTFLGVDLSLFDIFIAFLLFSAGISVIYKGVKSS